MVHYVVSRFQSISWLLTENFQVQVIKKTIDC